MMKSKNKTGEKKGEKKPISIQDKISYLWLRPLH